MEMSHVKQCDVSKCAYNRQNICHALAITVGGSATHPRCDTYCHSNHKGGDPEAMAGVGACKVESCEYNESLECCADDIRVGFKRDEIDCLTFSSRNNGGFLIFEDKVFNPLAATRDGGGGNASANCRERHGKDVKNNTDR